MRQLQKGCNAFRRSSSCLFCTERNSLHQDQIEILTLEPNRGLSNKRSRLNISKHIELVLVTCSTYWLQKCMDFMKKMRYTNWTMYDDMSIPVLEARAQVVKGWGGFVGGPRIKSQWVQKFTHNNDNNK